MPKADEEILITFRLPHAQVVALDKIGHDEDRSRANVLRRIVSEYLDSTKKKSR